MGTGERLELMGRIKSFQREIMRIKRAQWLMQLANHALKAGGEASLKGFGFSEEHIAQLRTRMISGQCPFGMSTFRRNQEMIVRLQKEIDSLVNIGLA
ncbi:hypothetical protein [Massilia sp. NR 4-1]|uniref:hypothetical protein n=1 Tax=Massilia sp. NR 4-1 TaxID=1678028 RepID=UPI00067C6466|nr:hypothetical protein [Massilia sp. NR 4-1]AKU21203.1 hypothetical protein ACZ75_06635 [Massilia sp. NR 4-1]